MILLTQFVYMTKYLSVSLTTTLRHLIHGRTLLNNQLNAFILLSILFSAAQDNPGQIFRRHLKYQNIIRNLYYIKPQCNIIPKDFLCHFLWSIKLKFPNIGKQWHTVRIITCFSVFSILSKFLEIRISRQGFLQIREN